MIVSLVGIVFLLIGLALLAHGIVSVFKVRRQAANSVRAAGTVIGFGRKQGKSGYLYYPQVAFTDAAGRKIEFESGVGAQPPGFTVGQKIEIVYQKDDPQKAEINSLMSLWFEPGCRSVLGLAFLFLGFVLFIVGIFVQLHT